MPESTKQGAKRPSRKSSPAAGTAGAKKQQQQKQEKSRAKSASPSASGSRTRGRPASKEAKAPPAKQQQEKQAQKPRSRSSSRTRKPVVLEPSPTSRQATPTADTRAVKRASRGRASGSNHDGRDGETSPRTAAAIAAAVASKPTVTLTPLAMTPPQQQQQLHQTRSSQSPQRRQAARRPREFGGPLGSVLLTVGLPAALVWLSLLSDGVASFSQRNPWLFALPRAVAIGDLVSLRAGAIYGGWLAFQLLLYCLPVGGRWVQQDGRWYHCNGLFALLVSLGGFVFASWWGVPAGRIVYEEATRLAVCSCLFSLLLSVCLFLRSHRRPTSALTAEVADAGAGSCGCSCSNGLYEFFMGRELHPRFVLNWVDLKFFLELRPGLIGWAVLDLAFLYQSGISRHSFASPFVHLVAMHLWYVTDAMLFERSILTTADIKREGLGFMLTFGNLAWVPFFYSLSARQLILHPARMPLYCIAGIQLLHLLGYYLFRVSNKLKDMYRTDPHHPKLVGFRTVPTGVRGHNLLADGFWGVVRHPNYTGDLIMATCWSLAAGFHSPLAWLYPVYLLALLVHRAVRDEAHCAGKYGQAWQRYCELVRYRLVPRIF